MGHKTKHLPFLGMCVWVCTSATPPNTNACAASCLRQTVHVNPNPTVALVLLTIKQRNGDDCGVLTICFANKLSAAGSCYEDLHDVTHSDMERKHPDQDLFPNLRENTIILPNVRPGNTGVVLSQEVIQYYTADDDVERVPCGRQFGNDVGI